MAEQLELFDDYQPAPGREASRDPAKKREAPRMMHPDRGPDPFLTRLASCYAKEFGLHPLAKRVSVEWNRRMRTAAGRAFYQSHQIELNPKLQTLPDDHRDREIFGTFLHELAHLISYARAGGKRIQPHGQEWKLACRDLGIPDEDRCHNLDFGTSKMKRRYAYECQACGSIVERVRKLKRPVACYECCRAHSGGIYDDRFRLVEKTIT
ncbi:MAG: SprT-like domain-containing protein [Verrucomicrobiota bacterium]